MNISWTCYKKESNKKTDCMSTKGTLLLYRGFLFWGMMVRLCEELKGDNKMESKNADRKVKLFY